MVSFRSYAAERPSFMILVINAVGMKKDDQREPPLCLKWAPGSGEIRNHSESPPGAGAGSRESPTKAEAGQQATPARPGVAMGVFFR